MAVDAARGLEREFLLQTVAYWAQAARWLTKALY
jgi:hypothetical protein